MSFDYSNRAGEFEFTIADFIPPLASLPDGNLATMTFTPLCQPTETNVIAAVGSSSRPAPTFGSHLGQDVLGRGVDGSVEILSGSPGDCNGDDILTAGDLSACVLEGFDGDRWIGRTLPEAASRVARSAVTPISCLFSSPVMARRSAWWFSR